MANDNDPRGLLPVTLGRGGVTAHYYRASTGADIYIGCPVSLLATGYVAPASVTGVTQYLGVALGFAGTLKRGVATPDPFLDVSDLTPPSPSSDTGDRWVLVADDPNQEYIVQEDTGGSALTLADAGTFCDLIYRGPTATAVTGDADHGFATLELDRSGIVTTTAAPVQILRLHDKVNVDGTENAVGNYGKWIVKIAHPQRGDTVLAAI